jgi:hypothetical protein
MQPQVRTRSHRRAQLTTSVVGVGITRDDLPTALALALLSVSPDGIDVDGSTCGQRKNIGVCVCVCVCVCACV